MRSRNSKTLSIYIASTREFMPRPVIAYGMVVSDGINSSEHWGVRPGQWAQLMEGFAAVRVLDALAENEGNLRPAIITPSGNLKTFVDQAATRDRKKTGRKRPVQEPELWRRLWKLWEQQHVGSRDAQTENDVAQIRRAKGLARAALTKPAGWPIYEDHTPIALG